MQQCLQVHTMQQCLQHAAMPTGSYHSAMPTGSYHAAMPTGSYHAAMPTGSYHAAMPTGSYHAAMPTGSYHAAMPTGSQLTLQQCIYNAYRLTGHIKCTYIPCNLEMIQGMTSFQSAASLVGNPELMCQGKGGQCEKEGP